MDSDQKLLLTAYINVQLGTIKLTAEENAVTGLYFCELHQPETIPPLLANAAQQIKSYFAGQLKVFHIPLKLYGTPFQRSVWQLLMDIPYGTTTTYGQLSDKLGMKNGARAVGLANGANPVSIIVPCHRVIGGNGKLTGYAGGLWRKEWLLKHECSEIKEGLFL